MGEDEETRTFNIEKTDDEEEVNARNEVTLEVNDGDANHNRNKRIVLKSKDKDVDVLLPEAIKAMKEDYYENSTKPNGKKEGGHIG